MKIGIATDPWKVKTFKEELTKAGYDYVFTDNKKIPLFTIEVAVNEVTKLQDVVRNINNKARNNKKH